MTKQQFESNGLISIIVPVYNVEEYLPQCVDSLLQQTYPNVEIILIDDGSSDQSSRICDAYAEKDQRVKVIHQKNQGVSAARNNGIAAATGEWMTFVDADDWLDTDACQRLINETQQQDGCDVVIFSFVKNYEEGEYPNKPLYSDNCVMQTPAELDALRVDVLEKQLDCNVLRLTFSKMIKRALIQGHGIIFNKAVPLCEDLLFWFETFQYARKVVYVNRFFYHYRQSINSATYRYRKDVCGEQDRMLSTLKALIDHTPAPEIFTRGYYMEVFYCMQRCITQGFYHVQNPASWLERRRASVRYFRESPYAEALKNIPFSELTRNHKIKYLMMKLRMYGVVESARNFYGKITGKTVK